MMRADELRDRLNQPTDPSLIRTRRQGGSELQYLEWQTINRILDIQCPGWSGTVREVYTAGDTVIVSYSISIPTADGIVTRGAVGSEKLGTGWDPVASAEQQGFKRAAARFGVGLDLYDKPAPTNKPKAKGTISREEWLALKDPNNAPIRPRVPATVLDGLSID